MQVAVAFQIPVLLKASQRCAQLVSLKNLSLENIPDVETKNFKPLGIGLLLCSVVGSFIIAVKVDMSSFELGALLNFFLPPIIGIITLLIFLGVCWISKNLTVRIIVLSLLCLYNLYAGLQLRHTFVPFPF